MTGAFPVASESEPGFVWGRQIVDEGVYQIDGSHIQEGRIAVDRENLSLPDGTLQPRNQILVRDGALVEKLLHQLVVPLGNHLHNRLMPLFGCFLEGFGNFDRGSLAIAIGVISGSFQFNQIDDSTEALFTADGDLHRNDRAAEVFLQ